MRPGLRIAAFFLALTPWGTAADAAPEGEFFAPAQPVRSAPLTTSTRQSAYTIPFRIEPPQTPGQQPVEVQLHVSTDGGATWELSSKVKPDKGAFVFRSPRDGDYCYSIRTVDAQGTVRPEGRLEPQLKVTVDTIAPRLELTAVRGAAGEIVARWRAVDPHLKAGSFKLEYQANSSELWEKVAVEPPPAAMRHTFTGETTWWPRTANGPLLVRAEISDDAGNPAVAQAVVKPGPPAEPGDVAHSLVPENSPAGASNPAKPSTNVNDPARWPIESSTATPLPRSSGGYSPPAIEPRPRDGNWRMSSISDPRGGQAAASAAGLSRGGPPGSPLDFSQLPAGQRPRMVNARTFELEYEIDSVGSSGVGKVELWGTRDGGRTWSIFGIDPDNRSPMPVNIDTEGIYGFRIVVQSGSGLGGRPPADGDAPDIWIGVDLTKPSGRITSTEVAAEAGELAIGWDAADDVLDTRPIAISFSATAGGPWTPIAAGLENTGSYRWRLDNRVPDRIFLRLEVRDEAGNIGAFETAEAASLDRHRPEGRIRGVRTLPPAN
jgi:hypothetical protein